MNRQEAAKILIHDDLFAMIALNEKLLERDKGMFALGFLLYYATIIINAVEWCKKAGIVLTASIDVDLLEKLRAKTKLYSSDSAIPFAEQQKMMGEIIEIEQLYWKKVHSKCVFRFLPLPDIGVYTVNGHNIGNTFEFAYEYSPFNPNRRPINEVMSSQTKEDSLSFKYGHMIGRNAANLAKYFDLDIRHARNQAKADVRIGRYDLNFSQNRFLAKNPNGIYALNLVCRMNYLLELIVQLCSGHRMFAFRMIYITFYHLRFDLDELGLNFVHYCMPFRDRTFRNAMAHYSLFGKISDAEIKPDVVGLGLFEKFFDKSFEDVNSAIIEEFTKTRDSLEQYVRVKGRIIYD